ncbi:unnamed protein product [Gadus morhua 'NCC']
MDERIPMQSLDRATGFSVDARTPMQLPPREKLNSSSSERWSNGSSRGATLNEKTKQIQERPEETGTLNREIQDLKEMLEVKERKVNDLQNRMENLQEQLRDKEKQMGSLKRRIKSLQVDTSNTDTVLTTLVESLAAKEHIIQWLKDQRFQEKGGAQDGPGGDCRQTQGPQHGLVPGEGGTEGPAVGFEEGAGREPLSFNVSPQLQPIETRQDRRGTAPPRRAAQPRRRVRDVERRDRIRQFQERDEREHLIRKRNWLEVEERRLDADCMELQFLERERQRIRFERRRERYGIQREQLRFGQDYRSGKSRTSAPWLHFSSSGSR